MFIVALFDDMRNILNLEVFTLIDSKYSVAPRNMKKTWTSGNEKKIPYLQIAVSYFTYWNCLINNFKRISSYTLKLRKQEYVLFPAVLS